MSLVTLLANEVGKGVLPPICLVCGASAPKSKRIGFTWAPVWTNLMLPLGLITCLGILPWLIFRLLRHRAMIVHTPLCDRHQLYWLKRSMVLPVGIFGTLAALIFVMFGLSEGRGPPTWALFIPFALLIGCCLASIALLFRGTRVVQITTEEITFEDVDPRFASAVESGRREYEQKTQEWLERHSQQS